MTEQKSLPRAHDFPHRCPPTFVVIGSLRCGSTWLHQVLKCHPDIQMSNRKEPTFFFTTEMLRYDLGWYESHFAPGNGAEPKLVRREISPVYSRLKAWQVDRIAKLLPDLRIVLTLRHPIERAWSQALLEFGYLKRKDARRISSFDFVRQVERARNRLSSDYFRTIRIWSNAFGESSLHIDFFDRLRDDPENYVNGILRHIGAATPWTVPVKFLKTKVHSSDSLMGSKREIPEVVEWYIADRLLEPTERLNELLDGRVSDWVAEMRAIRGKARPSWRVLREVNLVLFSFPERLAYEAYHKVLDARLWWRWQHLKREYVSNVDGVGRPRTSQV
jgi:hypothetical protein